MGFGGRLVILIGGLLAFAVLHSVLAADRVRLRGERALGSAQRYRLAYNLVSIALLGGALLASRGAYPIVWRAQGIARVGLLLVQAIAALGFLATVRGFRVSEFLGLAPRSAQGERFVGGRLQTDGLYARCRHPLYFFTALFFSAWPTMDLRALVVAIWLWAYGYVGSIFEERKLVAELGASYVAYRERTPRLLPFGRGRGASQS